MRLLIFRQMLNIGHIQPIQVIQCMHVNLYRFILFLILLAILLPEVHLIFLPYKHFFYSIIIHMVDFPM